MSEGQPIIKARCPRELLDVCKAYLAEKTFPGDSSPPTMSDLIVEALLEKMHHRLRGRKIPVPRPTSPQPDPGSRRKVDASSLDGVSECLESDDGVTVLFGEMLSAEED